MGHERLRSDGRRQYSSRESPEIRIVGDIEMLNLERVKRKDVTVRAIGRPRSAITAAEAGNFERHKIAVELARSRRHRGTAAGAFRKLSCVRRDIDDQPVRECAWKVELRRQIGISYADCETFGALRYARSDETRRYFILFGKAFRDDRSACDIRGAETECLVYLLLWMRRRFQSPENRVTIIFSQLAWLPGQRVPLVIVKFAG